jgi:ParB family transcriptional regulator, chromosome partitioning protein
MAEEMRPRLGRGLAALIGDAENSAPAPTRAQRKVPIEFVRTNPKNPRKAFDDGELDDLAASIREKGIIQPILTRAIPGIADIFEIIAGERRWRAAQRAGLHEVPIIIVEADDQQALELAIIENVQRTDLNALEEALGYERLSAEFGYNQTDLAKVIGKSRSHVANTIRLLKLPERTKKLLAEGKISAGHARALLSWPESDSLAERIVAQGLSVRDVERIVQDGLQSSNGTVEQSRSEPEPQSGKSRRTSKTADSQALEKTLTKSLGLAVSIAPKGDGGELRITYKTLEQLETLCARLQ